MPSSWPPERGVTTPTVPRSQTVFSTIGRTRIHAPASVVFAILLAWARYPDWNPFCPEITILEQPTDSSPYPLAGPSEPAVGARGEEPPAAGTDKRPVDAFEGELSLHNGTLFKLHAVMDPAHPSKRTPTQLRVCDMSTPESPSGRIPSQELASDGSWCPDLNKVYRIAWHGEGGGWWMKGLRAERVQEVVVLGDGECEYRTWECMGGALARTVKWMYKERLVERFEAWGKGLKEAAEKRVREGEGSKERPKQDGGE